MGIRVVQDLKKLRNWKRNVLKSFYWGLIRPTTSLLLLARLQKSRRGVRINGRGRCAWFHLGARPQRVRCYACQEPDCLKSLMMPCARRLLSSVWMN